MSGGQRVVSVRTARGGHVGDETVDLCPACYEAPETPRILGVGLVDISRGSHYSPDGCDACALRSVRVHSEAR